ncbi:MAG: hypothetical protein EHM89_00260 [Acidobacteria bacterium]|nr:MAG: hypothetical protein EHM89_00260 [Acidobacteriota bacterium]
MLTGLAIGFMAGQYIYHRWIEEKPHRPRPRSLDIPNVDAGLPVPLIYGRCRVRNPIPVWCGTPGAVDDYTAVNYPLGSSAYCMNMLFVVGIPFDDGKGETKLCGMWAGEKKFAGLNPLGASVETDVISEISGSFGRDGLVGSRIVYFDGNSSQDALDPWLDTYITNVTPDTIPGYRGYVTVLLFSNDDTTADRWLHGASPTIPAYSFEVFSYRTGGGYPASYPYERVGDESNVMNVLYDLLRAKFGKLGYDSSLIDIASFQAAAATLSSESHGYSRCIDSAEEADEHVMEILKQIDATLYEDASDGLIKIKLIRNDYDPNTIPHIHKDNGCELRGFAMGGWTSIVNKVRLVYTNRERDYQDDSETAQSPANAVGQDGQVNEEVISMPGVCTPALAAEMAARELAARSRPLMKCTAIVDRSFISVNPGDAVKVTWNKPDIAGIVFRVARVNRGTLENGAVELDLIQDYFYVFRGRIPHGSSFGHGSLVDVTLTL